MSFNLLTSQQKKAILEKSKTERMLVLYELLLVCELNPETFVLEKNSSAFAPYSDETHGLYHRALEAQKIVDLVIDIDSILAQI
jgi:hypothetical protein